MTVLPAAETELARQDVQRAGPSPALYVPAKHCEHVAPSAPVYPALHSHAVLMMLPAAETEFAGQPTQPEFPVPDLYVPPAHCVHVPPLGPFHPALQTHAATAVLAAGDEPEFAGHSLQIVLSK